ncbi:MAG: hypothetical protein ACK4NV_06520 [Pannonibacter sp.]
MFARLWVENLNDAVIPAQLSVSEAPSRDPEISRAERNIAFPVRGVDVALMMGSHALALTRWIPDLRFAALTLSGMTAEERDD